MPKIPPQVGEKVREIASDPNVRQYAAMAAIGTGLSTAAGARMDNTIERDKRKGVKQSNKWVDRAAKKEGKKYKPVGNNVYAKERKLFPSQSHEYVKQTVKDNKGSKNKIYLKTHYPNGVIGGLTMAKPADHKARIEGYPHLLNTDKNKVKDRYVASHEKRHVDQMAGTNQLPDMIDRAGAKAKKEVPKTSNVVADVVSLKAWKRNEEYKRSLKNESAQREGGADKYAREKHDVPSWKVTAYPQMANKKEWKPQLKNPLHSEPTPWAAGYKAGGGKGKPQYFSAERKSDKEQWKKKVSSVSKSAFGVEIEKAYKSPEAETRRKKRLVGLGVAGAGTGVSAVGAANMANAGFARAADYYEGVDSSGRAIPMWKGFAKKGGKQLAAGTALTAGGAYYHHKNKRKASPVSKSDTVGPFGVEIEKAFSPLKARKQVAGQMANVAAAGDKAKSGKGFKFTRLRDAQKSAGAKFQNK